MTQENSQLAINNPFEPTTFEGVEKLAGQIADCQMYGIKKPSQAITLMMMAKEEQTTITKLMRRIYVQEDGKITQRADYTLADFEANGGLAIWHIRTVEVVAASFIKAKTVDKEVRERAGARFKLQWKLDSMMAQEQRDQAAESKLMGELEAQSHEGEITILWWLSDAQARGICGKKPSWQINPTAMLSWRCVTEGIKVVDPARFAGLSADVEIEDLRTIESGNRQRLLTQPEVTEGDRESITAIIDQYTAELETCSPERRKTLLGLRSELKCKLDDLSVPSKPVTSEPEKAAGLSRAANSEPEAVASATTPDAELKPEETTTEPPKEKKTRARKANEPDPIAAEFTETPWRDIVCHLGNPGGAVHGKKLSEIFNSKVPAKHMGKLMEWFKAFSPKTGQDIGLMAGVEKAHKAWLEAQQPKTPSEAPKSTGAPASATEWGDFVIDSMNPFYNGKKLGDFCRDEIVKMRDEQFEKIKWATANPNQKKWRAMVFVALAEDDPLESNTVAPHIARLNEAINKNGVNRNDLLAECKRAGWISRDARAITDITPEEVDKLLSDWKTVVDLCLDALPK